MVVTFLILPFSLLNSTFRLAPPGFRVSPPVFFPFLLDAKKYGAFWSVQYTSRLFQ